jgi:hypothetical protein
VPSYRRLINLLILVLIFFFPQFLSPAVSSTQSSDKSKVDALYQRYKQMMKQGHYREAVQYAKELVPAGEKVFGKDHPNVASFLNNLAELYRTLGD